MAVTLQKTQDAQTGGPAPSARDKAQAGRKADGAFRTIGEVAEALAVPQHVLRFWETKFSQVRPLKRGGRRRYYRTEDVTLLARIQDLLHNQGYTIKGVQKILREGGKAALLAPDAPAPLPQAANRDHRHHLPPRPQQQPPAPGLTIAQRTALAAVLAELRALRAAL